MKMNEKETIKSGMACLVGPPNVGKSTLLNSMLGQKISIVSAKPQTTRNRILGIINHQEYQVVMLDTPGIHLASSPLNREMVRLAVESLAEVDVVVFMIDATMAKPKVNHDPIRYLDGLSSPAILLINKIDLLGKEKVLPLIKAYEEVHPFRAIIPISAKFNDGVDVVLREVLGLLPIGPRYYPDDIPTDSSSRFVVSEIIREKLFMLTGQEIPYSTAVMVDQYKDAPDGKQVTIHATIFIEKNSQKGIVIGKGGGKLKDIGKAARRDIEKMLDQKVVLKLWVKVKKNWTKNASFLKELGF